MDGMIFSVIEEQPLPPKENETEPLPPKLQRLSGHQGETFIRKKTCMDDFKKNRPFSFAL